MYYRIKIKNIIIDPYEERQHEHWVPILCETHTEAEKEAQNYQQIAPHAELEIIPVAGDMPRGDIIII